jgi:hypothetical protein
MPQSEDVQVDAGGTGPVRVSFKAAVILQIIVACAGIGVMWSTTTRDIKEQGKAIEEIQRKFDNNVSFQGEVIQRLVRIEERVEVLREGRRR